MRRSVFLLLALVCFLVLIVGCSAHHDKAELVRWLHSVDKDNSEVYLWGSKLGSDKCSSGKLLAEDEVVCLTEIFAELSGADITLNIDSDVDTLDYGLLLVVDGVECCIHGADTPYRSSEVCFRDKQWWIDRYELRDFMCDLVDRYQ